MIKREDILSSVIGILIYVLLIYGEVFGIYHAFKHHKKSDGITSIIVPPYAWYLSAEMWWHDDFADIDWDKRLTNDMRTIIYFLTQAGTKEVNIYELNNNLEEFSYKINKYPVEKIDFLNRGARTFIDYNNSILDDCFSAINEFSKNSTFDIIISDKTKKLEKQLMEFNLESEVERMKKQNEQIFKQVSEVLSSANNQDNNYKVEEFKESLNLIRETHEASFKMIFKNIFNEEL